MVTNNWTGDGRPNILGRNAKGELYLYTSDGHGTWLNNGVGQRIGTAWNQFKTFLSSGDFAGDDKIDLIGVTPGGVLDLYSTAGHGNWLDHGQARKIGSGWGAFTAVF